MPLQIATASFAALFTMMLMLGSQHFLDSRASSLDAAPVSHRLR